MHPFIASFVAFSFALPASAAVADYPSGGSIREQDSVALVSAFLVEPAEGASYLAPGSDARSMSAAVQEWIAAAKPHKVQTFARVAGDKPLASQLRRKLKPWTRNPVKNAADAALFLSDAADRAAEVIQAAVGEGAIAVDDARGLGVPVPREIAEKNAQAIERARRRAERKAGTVSFEGGDRSAEGGIPALALPFAAPGASSSRPDPGAPAAQRPRDFRAEAAAPPPPAPLTGSDKTINGALSIISLEAYSRTGSLNRESEEGTWSEICRLMRANDWNASAAWVQSKLERDKKGSDPGNLDLRNAEHYLYAYQTTENPNGWGDSRPVQLAMAAGWTPFKMVTKLFRPTSKPSVLEAEVGLKGAWEGGSPPDWARRCAGK